MVKRASIQISQRNKDDLDSIKHTGQSYNGLIQELVKFWKEHHGGERRSGTAVEGERD